jgi:hypothetical protein
MATSLKLRRGTTAQHASFTGSAAEVTVDTDKNTVVVHNGSTAGGFPLVRNGGNENVGIGTSSPSSKLTVTGTATANLFSVNASGGGDQFNVTALSAGGGAVMASLNSTAADYEPLRFIGEYLQFDTRTGVGTSTERMRIDASGNLGLGVTPSGWASSGAAWFRTLDMQNGGSVASFQNGISTQLISNAFFNGGSWQYKLNGVAGRYINDGNSHLWEAAPSGTAGNTISFTQVMKLDANGNLGVGTTGIQNYPNFKTIAVGGVVGGVIDFIASNTGVGSNRAAQLYTVSGSLAIATGLNDNIDERMRITSAGSLLVGTTTTYGKITSQQNDSGGYAGAGLTIVRSSNTNRWSFVIATSTNELYLGYNDADKGYFNISTGAYSAVSDSRLKKNIADISYGLNEILALRSVAYNMNDQEDTGVKALGFIAQEVMQVIPESVSEMQSGMYGMDKVAIIPVLVKAIQEQQAIITDLKARIESLENK